MACLGEPRGSTLFLSGVAVLNQLGAGHAIQQHAAEQARQHPHMLHCCMHATQSDVEGRECLLSAGTAVHMVHHCTQQLQ